MNKKKRIRINDVCEINRANIDTSEPPKEIYYLSTGNITNNTFDEVEHLIKERDKYPSRAKRKVKHNTIIYSTVRPEQVHYGILKHPKENFIVSTGFATLDVIDPEIDEQYLFYSLTRDDITQHLQRIGEIGVTSYPSITPDDIGGIEFDVPVKKEEQSEIANIISTLEEKIKINKKINRELRKVVKLVYDYWFVQFDFPDEVGNPYKSSGGNMVYNQDLKKKIPKGWQVQKLSQWIENEKNGCWGKENKEGNYTQKVTCIRGTDLNGLNGKEVIEAPQRFILEKKNNKILGKGDIIIEISGGSSNQSTGRMSFVIKETQERFQTPLTCSNFCKAVTLKDESLLYNFVYLWKRLYESDIFFDWESQTSGIKNLLFDNFVDRYKTVKPPKELKDRFYKYADQIHRKIQTNILKNQNLRNLRDWLLPMLMNGQVRVKGQDEIVKAAGSNVGYNEDKKPTNVDYYKRIVLAAEIVWQLHKQPTLGHLKLQKLIYLAQQSNNMNLPTNFLQQAAGPYDPRMARSLDKQLKKKTWFEYNKDELFKYKPLENAGEHQQDFDKFFSKEKEGIQYLIDTFKTAKSSSVEIAATLYACWKELLEGDQSFSEELLIEKFYDWSEEKAKYEEERLKKAISWMREKGIIPAQEFEMTS